MTKFTSLLRSLRAFLRCKQRAGARGVPARGHCFALFALLCALALCLGGCAPGEGGKNAASGANGCTLVGFSLAEANNSWTTDLIDRMSQMGKIYDMQIIHHDLEPKTSENQLADALDLIESGVDYLVLLPRTLDIVSEILDAADAAGVPVVLISNDLSLRKGNNALISIDYELEGRLCAQVLAEKYDHANCNIVEILGPEDSAIATVRDQGFREELKAYPWLHIVETIRGEFHRTTTQNEVTDLITRMPKGSFQAVFACSDEDGLGALNALKLAGYAPGEEVSIVSINGIQDALKALIAGEYTATIESGKSMGEQAIMMIDRLRKGDYKSLYWVMPYHIYDERSDAWTLDAALYW